jgi:hypothetical protein
MIESMQEVVSKINKAERELFRNLLRNDWGNRARFTGDKVRRDVRNWLSPPDPWKNHSIVHKSRHSGSGTWWIKGDAYAEWKYSGPSSLLWINGKRQCSMPVFFPETDDYCLYSGCGKERYLVR